ncbi:hypothetical protein EXU85_22660 [Spirosoma sp. KCTC 42546]|uniref:hypothetical protein n=1 Tax=Spirosoma sp. KCTC 42546 TaxID=2520506 RepID=UPI0011598633|nr:hypothetical protein [Spirosoma sp. KCTC 42546]QDK81258.1 hypothetical protein EXU85_22660 [Spirosoma sp. KCTC 42546]
MANPRRKSQGNNASKMLEENRALRHKNQELRDKLTATGTMFLIQNQRLNELQRENNRLIACLNRGATAMMEYQESFKN